MSERELRSFLGLLSVETLRAICADVLSARMSGRVAGGDEGEAAMTLSYEAYRALQAASKNKGVGREYS